MFCIVPNITLSLAHKHENGGGSEPDTDQPNYSAFIFFNKQGL